MHFEVEYFETRARPQKVTISVSEKKWRFLSRRKSDDLRECQKFCRRRRVMLRSRFHLELQCDQMTKSFFDYLAIYKNKY